MTITSEHLLPNSDYRLTDYDTAMARRKDKHTKHQPSKLGHLKSAAKVSTRAQETPNAA